jgi:hypothetical protein
MSHARVPIVTGHSERRLARRRRRHISDAADVRLGMDVAQNAVVSFQSGNDGITLQPRVFYRRVPGVICSMPRPTAGLVAVGQPLRRAVLEVAVAM